mgnify:CR=1 FL=1
MEQLYLSDRQVGARYGVHRTSIWRWFRDGNFPRPIKLSPGCTKWLLSDIVKWEAERINQARQAG